MNPPPPLPPPGPPGRLALVSVSACHHPLPPWLVALLPFPTLARSHWLVPSPSRPTPPPARARIADPIARGRCGTGWGRGSRTAPSSRSRGAPPRAPRPDDGGRTAPQASRPPPAAALAATVSPPAAGQPKTPCLPFWPGCGRKGVRQPRLRCRPSCPGTRWRSLNHTSTASLARGVPA